MGKEGDQKLPERLDIIYRKPLTKGPFNIYIDMKGWMGSKSNSTWDILIQCKLVQNVYFCLQGVGGWSKKLKILSTQLLNDPLCNTLVHEIIVVDYQKKI